jgi:carboxylesterase
MTMTRQRAPGARATEAATASRRPRRWLRRLLVSAGVLASVLALWHVTALVGVSLEETGTPRHADTGIAIGAEAMLLGSPESSRAALLVHGFVGGSNNFAELPGELAARGWRVRALRLPGHGTTPRDLLEIEADDLVDAVRSETSTLRAAGHDEVVLIGHSMGGALATLVAAEIEVDALVLAAPAFGVNHEWWYGLAPETWIEVLAPVVAWTYKGELFLQVDRREAVPEIYSYTWVPTAALQTLSELSARARDPAVLTWIDEPVLVLHSTGDVAASYDVTAQVVAAIPTARLVTFERSNHHLFHDHDRTRVIAEIISFLER